MKRFFLDCLDTFGFSRYRWFRRWAGGHWELWYIDYPVVSEHWLQVDKCAKQGDVRPPGLARILYECESHRE